MTKFLVNNLKPGMSFTQPAFIEAGNMLVEANQPLEAADLERLNKWGITEIESSGDIIEGAPRKVAAPQVAKPKSTPTEAISVDDRIKLYTDYENMRNRRDEFQQLIVNIGEQLTANIKMLVELKKFDNHTVLKLASNLADEVCENKLLLLCFHNLKTSISPTIVHAIHAASYSALAAKAMHYSRPHLHELVLGMLIMDSGMAKIPREIKEKDVALTGAEQAYISKHPLLGYQMLVQDAKVKGNVANLALQHHEAFDGSGYPRQLRGEAIDEMARIAAIADAYTAMVEKRSHRKSFDPYSAMRNLLTVELHRLDPNILKHFLSELSMFPLGSLIELNDGRIGLTLGCHPDKPMRPFLRIMRDENGNSLPELDFADLSLQNDAYIENILDPDESLVILEQEL